MKKTISILIFQLYIFNCFSQIEKNASFHSTFLKAKFYDDSTYQNNDTVLLTLEEEELIAIKYFFNGVKIKVIGYYKNGQKYRETNFNRIGRNGYDIIWYKDGRIKDFLYYRNNTKVLPSISFHKNGEIKMIDEYDIDLNYGIIRKWDSNRKLKEEILSINKTKKGCIKKTYYENDQLKNYIEYNIDKGKYICYSENGYLLKKGNIYNVELFQVGKWHEWHKNEQLSREYFFHDSIPNQREGIWKWWNEEGVLTKEEKYKNGELIDTKEYLLEIKEEID